MREGDWQCTECMFGPNFAARQACFKCGAGRPRRHNDRAAQVVRAATASGPVGAGGSRPLLSTFASRGGATDAMEPSWRKTGAAAAGKSYAEAAVQPRPRIPHVARQPPVQGAQLVQGTNRFSALGQDVDLPSRRGRWADEEIPCDKYGNGDEDSAYAEDDLAMEAEAEEEGEEEDGEAAEPTSEELRQAWLRECRAVKELAAKGRHEASAAMAAAREARDRAEEEWRRSRKPAPLSVRMGFAQKKLDKAAAALAKCRYELDEFDADVDRRRAMLCERIQEADDRYRSRMEQMDALHAEAGNLAQGASGSEEAARRTDQEAGVCHMLVEGIRTIAETLDEGSTAWEEINSLLAKAATAAAKSEHEQYDIGGDDGDMDMDDGETTWREVTHGKWNRHVRRGKGSGKLGPAASSTPCNGVPKGKGKDETNGTVGGTTERCGASQRKDGGSGNVGAGSAGSAGGAETRVTATAPAPPQRATRPREDGDGQEAERSKSRRGQDDETHQSVDLQGDDYRRALKLREEQAIAAAAAIECEAVFGDERSRQIAGQLYEHKVGLIGRRAAELGLDAMAGGRKLVELSPEDLAVWIRDVLEPAERAAKDEKDL